MDYSPWSNSESSFTRLLLLSPSAAAQLLARLQFTEGAGHFSERKEKKTLMTALMKSATEGASRG